MTIAELVLEAKVTDTERHAPFNYSVLDVRFENPEARAAFESLSEEDEQKFFEAMSEKYSEDSKDDPRW